MWEGERVPFYKVVGIISNGICSLSFALTTYGRKNNPFIFYEREFDVSLMVGPHAGPFGACVNSPAFFWVLGFMPLSFWMVPFSLSLSLLSPSPFPLISIADQRARRGLLRCSALPGYWIYCIWLRSGFALPLPSLCLPPSVRLAAPFLPPFFPAVGLRIKIRHFIVSKFCEADNIAAPIAAAERRERELERGPFGVGFATA